MYKRAVIRLLNCFLLQATILVSAVEAKTTLRLMTWSGYAPAKQIAEFEKDMSNKYGREVAVQVKYINSYDEAFQLVRTGEADVIVLVGHTLHDARYQYISNRLIMPLVPELVPNYHHVLEMYKSYTEHHGEIYAVPIASGPYGLAYNTRYFDKAPQSWNVLWDPQYKNHYAITNGIFEVNLYITALGLGYDRKKLGDFDYLNNPDFKNKLRSLVENSESFWPGIDEGYHLQGLRLATSWGFSIPALKKLGEEWKMASPKEGSPTWVDMHTINKSLMNQPFKKKIAHEWINFSLSSRFQLDVIVKGIATAPVTSTAINQLSKQQVEQFHLGDDEYLKKNRVTYPTIKLERNRNGMKYLWDKANEGIENKMRSKPD